MAKYKSAAAVPLVLDATGQPTVVPLLIKNGKSGSGVEVQVTGTAPSGFVVDTSAPAFGAGFGYAVSANDWFTGAAAGDAVVAVAAGKRVSFGVNGGAEALVVIDFAARRLKVGNVAASGVTFDIRDSADGSMRWGGSATNGQLNSTSTTIIIGAVTNHHLVLTSNNVERMRLRTDGDVVIGAGDTVATVLATGATAGFLRPSTCAGTPTGAAVDGSMVLDTTALKIWVRFGGAWKATAALT